MPTYSYKYKISRDSLYSPLSYGEHLLYQVGRIHCNADSEIPIHTQLDYFELTIATEGKGTVVTNNEPVEVSAGDIYISFAGDFHRIISDKDQPLKFDFITIKSRNEAIAACMEEIMAQHHAADRRVVRDEVILQLVSRTISEAKKQKKLSEKMMEALITEIFVLLIRDFDLPEQNEGTGSKTEAEMLCFRLMNYIDNHIYSIRNLRELADTTNYSYTYLSNLFKEITGTTLQGYYHNRRLETAQLLLASEDFTVSEIAGMLGYSSVYPFSLAFKKKFGYPPSEVKKNK
jgi:AraC-like DNA-binding protein